MFNFSVPLATSSILSFTLPTSSLIPSANFLTSSATTAKPFPASPAQAASIYAFNASKFVWSAISVIAVAVFFIFSIESIRISKVS